MIFSVFQKNWVFGYSWSTLLWYRCYYPHRSRDALSPVCGIFNLKIQFDSRIIIRFQLCLIVCAVLFGLLLTFSNVFSSFCFVRVVQFYGYLYNTFFSSFFLFFLFPVDCLYWLQCECQCELMMCTRDQKPESRTARLVLWRVEGEWRGQGEGKTDKGGKRKNEGTNRYQLNP